MEDGHVGCERKRKRRPAPSPMRESETDGHQRDRVRARDDSHSGAAVPVSRAQLIQQLSSGGKSGQAHDAAQAFHGRGSSGYSQVRVTPSREDRNMTHHHHPDRAWHPVLDDNRHYHNARHKSSPRQPRPSHHEAELQLADAHHIGRGNYGGRDSSPAIPRTPNLAAHGLEGSR